MIILKLTLKKRSADMGTGFVWIRVL